MFALPFKKIFSGPYPRIGNTRSHTKFSLLNINKIINETAISGTITRLHFIIVFKFNIASSFLGKSDFELILLIDKTLGYFIFVVILAGIIL